MGALVARQPAQHPVGHQERDQAERQVDPEDHRPVQMLGEEAAEHRPRDARGHEHAGDVALIAAPLPGRDHVGDDRLRERDQAAAAQPLERPGDDQDRHRGGERAGERARDEGADPDQKDQPAAMDVAELAVERGHRGRGQKVGGHHPGQVRGIAELATDGRQRGRDDRLVERRQQHRQQDADHDRAHRRMVERRRLAQLGRLNGHGGRSTQVSLRSIEGRLPARPINAARRAAAIEKWPTSPLVSRSVVISQEHRDVRVKTYLPTGRWSSRSRACRAWRCPASPACRRPAMARSPTAGVCATRSKSGSSRPG